VTAGKDILNQRGVVGTSTELVAGGDIMSKFIQEATVRAGGDIKVGSYIFNASVRAGGEVQVPGMGEGKSRALVGGLVWGAKGITARSIGSPYNASTRLVVGVDPDQVNRADQIRANMHTCEGKQRVLLKKLGVDRLDLDLIKQKLARCPSAKQKQAMLVAVKRIAKIAELERNQKVELEEIAEFQRKLALRTTINVLTDMFAGVEIRIGEQTELIREDCERCSFKLVIADEVQKIQQDVLKR
ncbi:MAG: FapA family protein, partial [bacterium]|nr:FapA family protein [bacterium]